MKYLQHIKIKITLSNLHHKKYNKKLIYINVESNHPNSVLKNISQSINKRLNKISSSEQNFKETVGQYQAALKASGHKNS